MDYHKFRMPDFNSIPRRDYLLALFSGVLVALSFPKPDLAVCAWVAFVPLFLAIGKKSPMKAFRLGCTCGLAAYAGILYWLNIAMVTFGKLPWGVSVFFYLLLAGYLALYFGVIAFFVRRGEEVGVSPLITFPILWVGLEYFRAFFLTGFPWGSLGYSQYRFLSLIQISDICGVYGVSFLIALTNVVIYRFIKGAVTGDRGAWPWKSAAILAILLALSLSYGRHRLAQAVSGQPLKVALIQGNIPQDVKWNPGFQEATVAIYERLSRKAAAAGCDLIVWPESAAPFFFPNDEPFSGRIRNLAKELKTALIFGAPGTAEVNSRITYRNSAFLVSAQGDTVGRSDKIHLVPFGEYVPLARFLPFVHKLVAGIGDFSPGEKAVSLSTGKADVGVLICFEGIFPELARAYTRAGSKVLVNISNDAWYKRSSAPYQHLAMTIFRAVENRVPFLRATNTGISAIVDSQGTVHDPTPLFQEAVVTGTVHLGTEETVYRHYGDIFARVCLGGTVLLILVVLLRRPRGRFAP